MPDIKVDLPPDTDDATPGDVLEWESPDGQRIAIVDVETGAVWMMKRLPPADASATLALLHRWSRVRYD